jgi:hypothetical protein
MQLHARDADSGNRISTSELREGDVLDGREILPGFRQPLAELFSTMRR